MRIRSTSSMLLTLLAACGGSQPGASPSPDQGNSGIVWPDEGPRTWAPRPTAPEITANDLRTRLYQFAADSMMGRESGTLGNFKGTDYIAREFKRLGLQPAGEHGSYFQELPFGPTGFDLTESRLSVGGTPLTPVADWVPTALSAFNGLAAAFSAENLPTVFAGRWGDTTVTLAPDMLRGKVVVFLAAPAAAPGGARGTAAVRDNRAQNGGAAAVLVASLDGMNQALRDGVFASRIALKPTSTPGGNATTGGAAISLAAVERIFGQSPERLVPGATGKPVSGAWSYGWRMSQYPGRNVIAILPGSDPTLRGTYVLLGAHNDHIGMVNGTRPEHDSLRAFNKVMRPQGANDRPGPPTAEQWDRIKALIAHARSIRPPRIDSVNNGADDDGSGTVVLLEIAERFASQPAPRRSMIFISHVGEEKGLLGSRWFVDHPTVPLDSIIGALNMDMLGKGRVTDVRFGGPNSVQMLGSRRLSAEYGELVDSLNAVRSEPMVIDYSWDRTNALNRFCRSDQVSYFSKNIPVAYFSLGYASDYHQPTDEPQYIDYDHGARLGRFVHDIAEAIANRPTRLTVLPLEQRDLSARCGQ
ncbi:MAG: M28 family peptidase [Gemmatimonadota bacterium]